MAAPRDLRPPILEDLLRTACILEATARKAGNVHPRRAFDALTYNDFVVSARAAAPILARTHELGVGRAIFEAIFATRQQVQSNTNLGIVLLLAPLAAVPASLRLTDEIADVLRALTREDADYAYRAIRLAEAGGLGTVEAEDVSQPPAGTLLQVMRLAADRDLIARQYAENFSLVLDLGLSSLVRVTEFARNWEPAIVRLQLEILSRYPDSLIARKCGMAIAEEASHRARAVLDASSQAGHLAQEAIDEFDRWLRADGNRRNPGTTADLIAAALFVAFRDGGLPVVHAH